MTGHGRPWLPWILGAVLFPLAAPGELLAEEPPKRVGPWVPALREDAELTDVEFVDSRLGWAVGGHGVIINTLDGGKNWRQQESPVDCRLESICFLDANNGWAAGGYSYPHLHTTQGVLLRTRDGGRTWARDQSLLLPALKRIEFVDQAAGWALSDASALFPTGLARTQDGGRTWTSIRGAESEGWVAGDFIDRWTGAAASRSSALAALRPRGAQEASSPGIALRRVHEIRLSTQHPGWLVGDGGLVLTSPDMGLSWRGPLGDPTAAAGQHFDWRAVESQGAHCWVAGAPGTRVLHSPDGGRSWQMHDTGQAMPIQALSFCDELHGWAVGGLGTVLATSDGGKTWTTQRAGGQRAAVLGLYSRAEDIPFELYTRLCGDEGYLAAVEVLTRSDQEPGPPSRWTLGDRSTAALAAVGVAASETAWGFPIRQPGLAMPAEQLADYWDRAHGGEGIEKLGRHVVQQIRTWRPDVVLTHGASLHGDDPLGHLVNQVVLQAVHQAADPNQYSDQIELMGLPTWEVKKVFGGMPAEQPGDVTLTTAQLAPSLGCSLAEHAAGPRGLISGDSGPAPAMIGFRLYVDRLPPGLGDRDFLSGIRPDAARATRRATQPLQVHNADALRRMAHKHRNMQAILASKAQDGRDPARFLAQVGDLTQGLDDQRAGELLYQLARQYALSGQGSSAIDTFGLLASGRPDHPLTPAALTWMVEHWASGEAAWRSFQEQAANAGDQLVIGGAALPPQPAGPGPLPPLGQAGVQPLAGLRQQGEPAATDRLQSLTAARAARAIALADVLQRRCAAAYSEPSLRFVLAAAQRRADQLSEAQRFYDELVLNRPQDAWWRCAAGEQWLRDRQGPPPKNVVYARAGARPHLDGELNDAIWDDAQRLKLASALGDDASWPAVALVAYDERFLYLGVDCRQAAPADYPQASGPRPRDADLSGRDRVEFFIDVDRDFATSYRLSIDHRGWTAESCTDDPTWNPTWFVAARTADGGWAAEAAIALDELSSATPGEATSWALGVQRIVPRAGFQSWTQPAAVRPMPEGFGYLILD